MRSLIEALLNKFPEAVLSVDVDTARSEMTVHVAAPRILEVARFLHDDPEACFDHITDICSADYPTISNDLKSSISCCRSRTADGSSENAGHRRQPVAGFSHKRLARRDILGTRSLRHDGNPVFRPPGPTPHPLAGRLCGRISAAEGLPDGRSRMAESVRFYSASR